MLTKALLIALILCESSGNPRALSDKGAVGLTQLTPIGVQEVQNQYGLPPPEDLTDPFTNVLYGSLLLQFYMKQTGTVKGALIMYNGGYAAWHAYRKRQPMPEETRLYVQRVMNLRSELDPMFFRILNEPQNPLSELVDRTFQNLDLNFPNTLPEK